MEIVILLYANMTALDAMGPYEVFNAMPGARVRFAAKKKGVHDTDTGIPLLNAAFSLDEIESADVLIIPGARPPFYRHVMQDPDVLEWVRKIDATTKWTTSVCSGALILGAAGLLDGLQAATHWFCYEELAALGVTPTQQRVVQQGKIITSAGVSAGIDMALTLVATEVGPEMAMGIQLALEYDPQPPFDAGSPEKAPKEVYERMHGLLAMASAQS